MSKVSDLLAWDDVKARDVAAPFVDMAGGLLPALHELQRVFGYVDDGAVPILADLFNFSRAEVHGVISFYHDFRRERRGRHVIKVCRSEACQAMRGNELIDHIKTRLDLDFHETNASETFSLEPVYCLGNCAAAPAIMIDERVQGRVSPDKFDALVSSLDGEGSV